MFARPVALAVLLLAPVAFAQEAQPIPTADQIKEQVGSGQYRPALQGLMRILNLKGPAAEAYNRPDMLMLRAECQLQVRETRSALDSLAQAQKEAAAAGDADRLGAGLAMQLLIQKSPAFKYTPRSTTGPIAKKPIDILDLKARPDAYKALFEDELVGVRATVRKAETSTSLVPLMDASKQVAALRGVEKVATGDTVQSKEFAESLGSHAAALLGSGVAELASKTEAIAARANTIVTTPVAYRDQAGLPRLDNISHRRGLEGSDIQDLRNVQNTCTQVISAATDLAMILPSQATAFKEAASTARGVGAKANVVLNDNYNEMPATPVYPGGTPLR